MNREQKWVQGKAGSTLPWEWKQEVEALQGWFEVTALDQTVWRAKQSLGKATSFLYRYQQRATKVSSLSGITSHFYFRFRT